jgi:hypothetical protein
MRLPLLKAQRVESGLEMAADAVDADQHECPQAVQRSGAQLILVECHGGCRGAVQRRMAVGFDGCRSGRTVGLGGWLLADDGGGVGCPARPAQFVQHFPRVVVQLGEEAVPAWVDGLWIFEIAGVQLGNEGGIRAEQER